MEPLLIVLVPGILGGILVALIASRLTGARPPVPVRHQLRTADPGLINMAHIKIDGLGGLGMVAMALAVAISVPLIRASVTLALVLGAVVAAVLIAWRYRSGPLTSSSRHAGAHSDSWAWDEKP
jgi:hypothetical protein